MSGPVPPSSVPAPPPRRGPTTSLPRHPERRQWLEPAPHELVELGPPPQDPFQRSAHRWMRAYPRRWRRVRGDEMLAVLEDLAEPGATRLDLRAGLDLVRGGLATRWRGRPPFWRWVLYRTFDVRLPREYRAWAFDDIDGAMFGLRQWLAGTWFLVLILLIASPEWLDGPPFFWAVIGTTAAVSATNTAYRSTARMRHLEPRRDEPLLPGTLVPRSAPRRRIAARPVSTVVLVALSTLAVLSLVALAVAPTALHLTVYGPDGTPGQLGGWETASGPAAGKEAAVGVLAAAAVVGLVVLLLARRLVQRVRTPDGLATTPEQAVVRLSGTHVARVAVWTGALAMPLWFEATGDNAILWSVALGSVCLALLPTAAFASRLARRAPWETSARDVLAALRGTRRPVDDPEIVFVPVGGPEAWPVGPGRAPRPVT